MPKSEYAHAVDQIQAALKDELRSAGFRVRGRTFNRLTDDGLTQVVNLQMGPSDPPGATHIPGLTDDLYGLFAVNLGVYVPEVAEARGNVAKAWVQDYNCNVRSRLGPLVGNKGKDLWWAATNDPAVVADVRRCITEVGIPFLDSYGSRDKILWEWRERSENMGISDPPRIVMAAILFEARTTTRRASPSLGTSPRSRSLPTQVEKGPR